MNVNNKRWLILALAALLVAVTGCSALGGLGESKKESSSEAPSESSEEVKDPNFPVSAGGATVTEKQRAVVSLSPAITEKIFDLGLESALAGVSDYCDRPAAANDLPRCGTAKTPDLAEIQKSKATLVLCENEPGESSRESLGQMGAEVAVLPHAGSVDGVLENYRAIARLMEGDLDGAEVFAGFEQNFRDRLQFMEASAEKPVPAVYLRMLDYTVATGDTLENELMELIGCDNIAKGQSGWEFKSADANGDGRALFQSLGVIFMDEKYVNIKMLEKSAFYKGLNAVLKDKYVYIDSSAFERQSMRMLDELEKMAESEFVKAA